MKTLLEKNNFEIIHFEHCGYYRSFEFMIYRLKLEKYFKYLQNDYLKNNLNMYLNLYDIMFVIAKKLD